MRKYTRILYVVHSEWQVKLYMNSYYATMYVTHFRRDYHDSERYRATGSDDESKQSRCQFLIRSVTPALDGGLLYYTPISFLVQSSFSLVLCFR